MKKQNQKYYWEIGCEPPLIDIHSIKKHEILREYLSQYIKIVGGSYYSDSLTLTLVDAFAGGGLYKSKEGEYLDGSPLIFLKTSKEAEAYLATIKKQFKLNANYIFIDTNKIYLDYLKELLINEGFKKQINNEIFLFNGSFESKIDLIVNHIQKRKGKANRCIFLLDQYGYGDVPFYSIRRIFQSFDKAEILLTFSVDFLIDYMNNSLKFQKIFNKLNIANFTKYLENFEEEKKQKHWRVIIQKKLYKHIIEASGAKFHTNFFIKSSESSRSYWFLHLSQHMKAKDEMQKIHWKLENTFAHQGKGGFNMLAYYPEKDIEYTRQPHLPTFVFSNKDKETSMNLLMSELPALTTKEGMPVKLFFEKQCNQTTATYDMIKEVIRNPMIRNEISLFTKNGHSKKNNSKINDKDIIQRNQQKKLFHM